MSAIDQPSNRPAPQSLAEMFKRYLQQQASAHCEGFGTLAAGEVVPFEAAPVQPIDPRLAWEEAVAAARYYATKVNEKALCVPPDWGVLTTAQEPALALPFCLGNYPQMVRDLRGLLQATDSATQAASARPLSAPATSEWAADLARRKAFPQALLGIAALRLARQYDEAEGLAEQLQAGCPSEWRPALANERAALAWQRGRREEAAGQWRSLDASVPVLFNRGMAALFLGHPKEARTWLLQAVGQLPEESGWHHLARLYLALAEMRA